MHPSQPIPATTDDLAWLVGRWLGEHEERWMVYRTQPDSGELLTWFETQAQPHQPGDEFRYARR